eukprot:Clim_evm88s157 gene=Clim_evmTU88s157
MEPPNYLRSNGTSNGTRNGAKTNGIGGAPTHDGIDLEGYRASLETSQLLPESKVTRRDETKQPLSERGPQGRKRSTQRFYLLAIILAASLCTRLYHIAHPSRVVFDEVHFGKFAAFYIRNAYFFDVHPPLAKMMIAANAWMNGFDGDFLFTQINRVYKDTGAPYVQMRIFGAAFGIILPPLAFLTAETMGLSVHGATLAAAMVLLDDALVGQSRLIFLDSFLLAFTCIAFYCEAKFYEAEKRREFSGAWLGWLLATGIFLGLSLSVKWVGLFIIAYVGYRVVYDLAIKLHYVLILKREKLDWFFIHFAARANCLILIPLCLYAFTFYIHFNILTEPGPGIVFHDESDQLRLKANVPWGPDIIDEGSEIMLVTRASRWALLHSHPFVLEKKRHPVTAMQLMDERNWWSIEVIGNDVVPGQDIMDQDLVRIKHVETGLYVKVDKEIKAPMTKDTFMVFLGAYQTDESDHIFRLFFEKPQDEIIVGNEDDEDLDDVKSTVPMTQLSTIFYIQHVTTGCDLAVVRDNQVKGDGLREMEVVCTDPDVATKRKIKNKQKEWTVQGHRNSIRKEPTEITFPEKKHWLKRFYEIQIIMWQANSRITRGHPYRSEPWQWMPLLLGVGYWVQRPKGQQIFLFGNPLIWWTALAFVILWFMLVTVQLIRVRSISARALSRGQNALDSNLLLAGGSALFAWLLHYFPFYLMGRQLFLHHYLPAFYFSLLNAAAVFDILLKMVHYSRARTLVTGLIILVYGWAFVQFSPLAYGTTCVADCLENIRWLPSWNWYEIKEVKA